MLKQKREAKLSCSLKILAYSLINRKNKTDHKEDQEKWQRKINLEEEHVALPWLHDATFRLMSSLLFSRSPQFRSAQFKYQCSFTFFLFYSSPPSGLPLLKILMCFYSYRDFEKNHRECKKYFIRCYIRY